jgi:hypothetical protein
MMPAFISRSSTPASAIIESQLIESEVFPTAVFGGG